MADDFLGSTATTATLGIGVSVAGNVETGGDTDWFKLNLLAGYTYTFDLHGVDSSGGTLVDPYLILRDSNGISLREDDDTGTGRDSSIGGYTPILSGTYFLTARAFSSSATGTYTIAATQTGTPPADDFAGSPTTNGTLVANASVGGKLDFGGDTDWFAITLDATRVYQFDLQGFGSGSGTLSDPLLNIYDSNGVLVASDDDSGLGSDASISDFAPEHSGKYYLSAEGYPGFGFTGTYQLTATAVGNNLPSSQLLLDGIYLSALVYNDNFDPIFRTPGGAGRGWTLVSDSELGATGLALAAFTDHVLFNGGIGEAFVARRDDEIALVFRGSENVDWAADAALPATIQLYYAQFAAWLTGAFDAYVKSIPGAKGYVFGHSLGGALAETFMSLHADQFYRAVTFGSPGIATGDALIGNTDGRVFNVEHSEDIVPQLPGPIMNPSGTRILIDIPINLGGFDAGEEHRSGNYLESVKMIDQSGLYAQAGTREIYVGRDASSDYIDLSTMLNAAFALGGAGNDSVGGTVHSDILSGGTGADVLVGNAGDDLLQGGSDADDLTGGPGADTFLLQADSLALAPNHLDIIHDFDRGNSRTFSLSEGDVIDISAIVAAGGGQNQPDQSLWRLQRVLGKDGSLLMVDPDGTGLAHGWTPVAWLEGVSASERGITVITGANGDPSLIHQNSRVMMCDSTGRIYTWDINSGIVGEVVNTGLPLTDIATAPDGSLYGITGVALYKIDPIGGSVRKIADVDASKVAGTYENLLVAHPDWGSLGVDFEKSTASAFDISPTGDARIAFSAYNDIVSVNLTTGKMDRVSSAASGIDGAGDLLYENKFSDQHQYYLASSFTGRLHEYGWVTLTGQIQYFETSVKFYFMNNRNISGLVSVPSTVSGLSTLGVIGFDAAAGYDLGSAGSTLTGKIQNFSLSGAITGATRYTSALDALILGTGNNDNISGTDAVDLLKGGAGNDMIDGSNGIDRAVFLATRAQSTLTHTNGTLTVSSALDGNDTTVRVEQFQFSDGLYSFTFTNPGTAVVANFNPANGWASQDQNPRHVADINGDGYADIVGFGFSGVLVSFGAANGSYSNAAVVVANFGQTAGWSSDNSFHRELADVNGDGRADIIGFGIAGTLVSLAKADGTFDNPFTGVANFGANQGWASQNGFARFVGDVNGDGKADLVGFGFAGTLVSLGNGDGTFKPVQTGLANFGVNQGWTSDTSFHRAVADVNGDGKADIVGFGIAGTYVALSNGDGTFANASLVLNDFGANQGWASNDSFARLVTDVNGDHMADIVGFGIAGTLVAFGNADGTFTAASTDLANFGRTQGWSSDNTFHREVADINKDGLADIVGFGVAGVLVGQNQGDFLV